MRSQTRHVRTATVVQLNLDVEVYPPGSAPAAACRRLEAEVSPQAGPLLIGIVRVYLVGIEVPT
jgi:hypothetical protein